MANKTTDKKNSYLPVAWEYREVIEEQMDKKNSGKVFYFDEDNKLEESGGRIVEINEEKSEGVFILMDNGLRIRIDRIITLFGKVGAAYNEYDAYSNACMDCSGGYTKEELDNM